MRFEVINLSSGKYSILDNKEGKLCCYSGKATNPPQYKEESKCKEFEWNNYHSALGFSKKLDAANNGLGYSVS